MRERELECPTARQSCTGRNLLLPHPQSSPPPPVPCQSLSSPSFPLFPCKSDREVAKKMAGR